MNRAKQTAHPPMSLSSRCLRLGATLGFTAVALGAFGAHALKDRLEETVRGAEYWQTATHYALIHAVAILAYAGYADNAPRATAAKAAPFAWACGTLVFSGTLMAMALGAPKTLGAITPLGGLALLAGWTLAAVSSLPAAQSNR